MYIHISPKDRYKNGHSRTTHNSQSSIAGRITCPLERRQEVFTFVLLLLLLLSSFSRVQLCATPWTAAHQAPPSLGFSRQEHWSGLPFPSPMHESRKWKRNRSVISDWLFVTPWTAAYQPPPSMGFSRQEYWSGLPVPSLVEAYCLEKNIPFQLITCTGTRLKTSTGRQITKTILEGEGGQSWRFSLPGFKTHDKVTVTKTVWNRHKARHKDQRNRIESQEMNPHIHDQLTQWKLC